MSCERYFTTISVEEREVCFVLFCFFQSKPNEGELRMRLKILGACKESLAFVLMGGGLLSSQGCRKAEELV